MWLGPCIPPHAGETTGELRPPRPTRNLDSQVQHLLQRQRLAGNAVLQRLPIEKLQRNERLIVVFSDFMDGANIGMVQGGSRLCLAVKAAQSL
jgi:hypothetical protein